MKFGKCWCARLVRAVLSTVGLGVLAGCGNLTIGSVTPHAFTAYVPASARPTAYMQTAVHTQPIASVTAPISAQLPAMDAAELTTTAPQAASIWMNHSPTRGELLVWVALMLVWRGVNRRWHAHRMRRQLQERLEMALQGRLRSQQHFHAMLAHELRGPIASVTAQMDNLSALPLNSRAQHQVKRMRQGLNRVGGLLEQLLRLTRVNLEPPLSSPTAQAQVQAVLREVLEELMPQALRRGQQVTLSPCEDMDVAVTPFDLHTLLRNLIDNAIRYSPEGGCIDISLTQWSQQIWIQVADNGPGIPEDALQRVFEPFFRVGQQVEGTGLGLAIVHRLAQRWHGRVVMRNRDSGGLLASLELRAAPKGLH